MRLKKEFLKCFPSFGFGYIRRGEKWSCFVLYDASQTELGGALCALWVNDQLDPQLRYIIRLLL
jgi:hypothetical protein